jgi:hypothetical protein
MPVYCLSSKKSFQRPFTSASPSVHSIGWHEAQIIGIPRAMFDTSNTRRFNGGALNVLNLVNDKQFDSALLKIQDKLHKQNFLVVTPEIRLSTFQKHAPEEWLGGVLASICFYANDWNTIPF